MAALHGWAEDDHGRDLGQEHEHGHDSDADGSSSAPVWAAFGDLMAGLLGAFVLLLVAVVGLQLEFSSRLETELQQRRQDEQRLRTLEQALAAPLAAGRVTLVDGRIGIAGSVLFALGSDQLQPEGRQLLASLAAPLAGYLQGRDELLMVSGFTDDRAVRDGSRRFEDNWELSAQRALTVTRALIDAGLPASSVFAAAFGPQQPVASNADAAGRAKNRRVEMAPVPRGRQAASAAPTASAASVAQATPVAPAASTSQPTK